MPVTSSCRRPLPQAVALVAMIGTVAGCSSTSKRHTTVSRNSVQVSVSQCGVGWRDGKAGAAHMQLHNSDSRPGEARVIDPRSGAVFADVEPFGEGTSTPLDVTLRAGTYALQCLMEDEAPSIGRPVHLRGALAAGVVTAPGVVPVSQADLIPATKSYERYVSRQLPRLQLDVASLHQAATSGDRGATKRDWLTAHLRYERLGGAYDAFGDLDSAINGRRGNDWSGFHLIEYGLWHGTAMPAIARQVATLQTDVTELRKQFADTQLDPLQIGIRAHEISENALQFSLTGQDDYGSHTDLDTVRANLQGSKVVLGMVNSLLVSRHVDLAAIRASIQRTEAELDREPVDRMRLDAALSEQCELLAPVAAVLEPRRTS